MRGASLEITLTVPFKVIYDKLFPNNPAAVKSLKMEDWDVFTSPWASSAEDEEVFKFFSDLLTFYKIDFDDNFILFLL